MTAVSDLGGMFEKGARHEPLPSARTSTYVHRYRFGCRELVRCENRPMLVNESVRKCVMFVGCQKGTDKKYVGTAFLLLHPIEGTDRFEGYFVSAGHVITAAHKESDGNVYLRLNEQSGSSVWLKTDFAEWEFHEDLNVDLAAKVLDVSEEDILHRFDHITVSSDQLILDDGMAELGIIPGEDLYFPGLFSRHPGNEANVPILRTGTLAAPSPVKIKWSTKHGTGGLANMYLAEVRSIGGHSGSPVFVHLNTIEKAYVLRKREAKTPNLPPLLGLVHGHYDDEEQEKLNLGIALIVPAADILHLINQPRFVKLRKEEADRILSDQGPTTPD